MVRRWAGVAVAAIEDQALQASLLAAALALQVGCPLALAETAPEQAYVGLKVLDYQDRQPDAQRIRVQAQALTGMVPLGSDWSLSGTLIADSISGASPLFHAKALTPMRDKRHAADLALTRYLPQGTWNAGASHSQESDYLSRSIYGGMTRSDEGRNTTWGLSGSLAQDVINPVNQLVRDETRQSVDLLGSLTQVMSERDLVQLALGWSRSQGYMSDPYKLLDERPRGRTRQTLQLRWNHHLDGHNATVRSGYRYFRDDWGIAAHTLDVEYVQPLGPDWKLTPLLRYYTQGAARFYVDADGSRSPFAPSPAPDAVHYALDQRLSAFGALTLGAKLSYRWQDNTQLDFKIEQYEQRAAWTWGAGSPNLPVFRARFIQWGLTHWF